MEPEHLGIGTALKSLYTSVHIQTEYQFCYLLEEGKVSQRCPYESCTQIWEHFLGKMCSVALQRCAALTNLLLPHNLESNLEPSRTSSTPGALRLKVHAHGKREAGAGAATAAALTRPPQPQP